MPTFLKTFCVKSGETFIFEKAGSEIVSCGCLNNPVTGIGTQVPTETPDPGRRNLQENQFVNSARDTYAEAHTRPAGAVEDNRKALWAADD